MYRIYLDNCCFNRPYDDQESRVIRLESEAKMMIQEKIKLGKDELVRLCQVADNKIIVLG